MLDEHVHALQEDKPIASFGLDALNSILGGVYPGLNYAIGTAPGKGKTTLALQEADKLAADGHPVIYVSAELPAHKLIEKSLARLSDGKVALSEVSSCATQNHPKHTTFEAALDKYRTQIAPNLCITGPLNTVELSSLVGLVTRERGEVPIVFIDYLQLLACGVTADQQFIDERLAITACVKGLREISNLYGSPVIALSSTTRKSYDSGKSARPTSPCSVVPPLSSTALTRCSTSPMTMTSPSGPTSLPQPARPSSTSPSRTATARWASPDSTSTVRAPPSTTGASPCVAKPRPRI